jgi:hypothetical protein
MDYVSRVPRTPPDGLVDDLYYLEGAPPYARLTLPLMQAALLIVNLGASSGRSPAHADPLRRSPAAVPARTSRPPAGRLAAAG